MQDALLDALRDFAESVKAKVAANAPGEPEAQLSGPISTLVERFGRISHRKIIPKAESRLGNRLGIADFAVLTEGLFCCYLELKAPGEGADTNRYKGRNKDQWERFKAQPNIIYSDGNEWCLYQNGSPAEKLLRFSKDITQYGREGVTDADAEHFQSIFTKALAWSPIVPEKTRDQAALLAPLCGLLRGDVSDAIKDPASPLVALAKDWRSLLFPDASDDRFADAYAQTVTFALLLARSEGADVANVTNAVSKLEAGHTLLSRALQVLTDTKSRLEIEPSLILLQRVINAFPQAAMSQGDEDPWLYFYEHFLEVYDSKLRKDSGVYYTPVPVVKCQVALVDDILRTRLQKSAGFTDDGVVTLDPAVGTGTYLLGVIDHAMASIEKTQGTGAIAAKASTLAANIYGFELMTGPYAVAELRLTRALKDRGAELPFIDEEQRRRGLGIMLADTLESPFAKPPSLPQFFQPIAEQHVRALEIKDTKSVIVCLGNPPYDRHDAVGELNQSSRARTGGWVRWGDSGDGKSAIMSAFIDPAKEAGHGIALKNLYNLYIYFWRWALWKVFEHTSGKPKQNSGIVSFISASSYIRGDAFVGMREMLRKLCHELYIIDLGGEGRGTRQDANVFNIQTPVAICIAVRRGNKEKDVPAQTKYTSIRGTRQEKYATLAKIKSLRNLKWKSCPTNWQAPLRPAGTGPYFLWPLLTDLMPWQTGGAQLKRKWPVAPDDNTLRRRWKALLQANDRSQAFVESRDRKVTGRYPALHGVETTPDTYKPISELTLKSKLPPWRSYAYRSFDRQRIIADNRVGDYMRKPLWLAHSDKQLYLTSFFSQPLGQGPAVVASAQIPDLDTFRGSFGAKASLPLYRNAAATEPNILPGFLSLWSKKISRKITPSSFVAYIYAILAHPAFVERFWEELEDCQLRVPITLEAKLFDKAVESGTRLLFLHTYGERFATKTQRSGDIPFGSAKNIESISDKSIDYPDEFSYFHGTRTLRVGKGTICPIDPAVWEYEISGLKVVQSWLGYRMEHGKGKKSSSLDDISPECWTSEFTDELLRLLWILEHTLKIQQEFLNVLDATCTQRLFMASDLPPVSAHLRKPPSADGTLESEYDLNEDQD